MLSKANKTSTTFLGLRWKTVDSPYQN